MIAYVIPGLVALCGVAMHFPAVRGWMVASSEPSVGGFLYVMLASVALGMTASAVRWAVIDSLHHLTGLRRPTWDDSKLTGNLSAVDYLVECYYRYYQFYGNSFVAVLFAYVAWRFSVHGAVISSVWFDAGVVFIEGVYLAGSRDALRKYYQGTSMLLGTKRKGGFQ